MDYFISSKSILTLTGLFFSLFALTATQDIAVDGWAVTLLSPRIRGHSSTCQSIGELSAQFGVSFDMFARRGFLVFSSCWSSIFIRILHCVLLLRQGNTHVKLFVLIKCSFRVCRLLSRRGSALAQCCLDQAAAMCEIQRISHGAAVQVLREIEGSPSGVE